jgi:hypothetical protein
LPFGTEGALPTGETRSRLEKQNEKRKHYEIKNEDGLRSSYDGSRDYDRRSIERTRSGR